jgi:hypothetical protein
MSLLNNLENNIKAFEKDTYVSTSQAVCAMNTFTWCTTP